MINNHCYNYQEIKQTSQPDYFQFHFWWTENKRHSCGSYVPRWPPTHLVGFCLLLFLLLLLLVFFLISAVTSFGPGSTRLAWPGLPRRVPSTFGVRLPRIGCVRVRIWVDLKQSEAGGRGRDSDHCRWCHCDKRKVAGNKGETNGIWGNWRQPAAGRNLHNKENNIFALTWMVSPTVKKQSFSNYCQQLLDGHFKDSQSPTQLAAEVVSPVNCRLSRLW